MKGKLRRSAWRRLKQIAEVMAHHGLIMVSDALGLSSYLSLGKRIRAEKLPAIDAEWPDRVRMALADLGPTYVKIGQLASTRPDILPDKLIRALEHLQDDVPPFPYGKVVETVEHAWGRSLTDVVQWIDERPLAAASIGQVHQARLYDGRAVVIKVRRPGIREQAEADFRILESLAEVAEKRTDWAKPYEVRDLVEELAMTMRDELDFTVEAQNTETARKNLGSQGRVRIPGVVWTLTHEDVLVLESVRGLKINDMPALEMSGLSVKTLAQDYVQTLYQQIFVHGFFHADPHPGNVHVDEKGQLIFLDWGLVGILSREMRARSVQLVLGFVEGRSEAVADALVTVGSAHRHVDRGALLRDVERLRRHYYESSLKDFQLGQAMSELFSVAQRHQLKIPAEYMLLAKTAVTADGVVRALDPEFSLMKMGQPLAGELLWDRLNPANWGPEALRNGEKLAATIAAIPDEVTDALRTLSKGEVRIILEHKNIDRILAHWEMLINRVALAFLLGAVVLGAALVVHRNHLDQLAGLPVGEYAFFLTIVLAVWAILGAVRRRKF